MTFGGNSHLGHQHRFQPSYDHRPKTLAVAQTWMSPWPRVAAEASQICKHASLHSPTPGQQGPYTSTWSPVPAQTTDIRLAFGGNSGHTETDPSCSRTTDADMALGGSPGPGPRHGLLISVCSSLPWSLWFHLLHSVPNPQLLFVFHLSACTPSFLSPHHTFIHHRVAPVASTWMPFFQPPWAGVVSIFFFFNFICL